MSGGRPDDRRVLLFGHRFAANDATGIGRTLRETVMAVDRSNVTTGVQVVPCAAREADRELDLRTPIVDIATPRKLLYPLWTTAGWPRLDSARLAGGCDLVHVQHAFVRVPTSAPRIYTVHDLMPIEHPEWYTRRERRLFRTAYRDVAERARHIVAVSQSVADQLASRLAIPRRRITVIHNGVSDFLFDPIPPAQIERVTEARGVRVGSYVIAVGAVSTRKNLLPLVGAMAELPPGIDLLLVGPDGFGAARVRNATEGSSSRVRLVGRVPDIELRALLAGALALVHPSLDEGFGLPPLEAMAVGTPAVVAKTAALPEVTGPAAIVVDPHDASAWAEQISRLHGDAGARAAIAELGVVHARTFSWDRAAARLIELYRDCLQSGQ